MEQEESRQPMEWSVNFGSSSEYEREKKSILNPPKSYIDYRCITHEMNGPELESIQKKFFRDKNEMQKEVKTFFNWIIEQRNELKLPIERIRRRYPNGKEDLEAQYMMIYDIEYWLEGGRIMQKKIYLPLKDKEVPFHDEVPF
jgi:hypothetical protein